MLLYLVELIFEIGSFLSYMMMNNLPEWKSVFVFIAKSRLVIPTEVQKLVIYHVWNCSLKGASSSKALYLHFPKGKQRKEYQEILLEKFELSTTCGFKVAFIVTVLPFC